MRETFTGKEIAGEMERLANENIKLKQKYHDANASVVRIHENRKQVITERDEARETARRLLKYSNDDFYGLEIDDVKSQYPWLEETDV